MKKGNKNVIITAMLSIMLAIFCKSSYAQNTFPANGNVGIGITTPQAPVHIRGNQVFIQNSGEARFRLYNNGGQAEWILGQKSATEHNFLLSRKIGASEVDFLNITAGGRMHIAGPELLYLLNQSGVIVSKSWGGNGNLTIEGTLSMSGPSQIIGGTGRLHVDGPEYLYILNRAGVVIGKDWGGTGNLQVHGTILTSKVKVAVFGGANWSWADYVFDKGYKLKSLPEVEAYIKANKHLEGMPTTEDVKRDGLDIAPVTAKLLEKIEELTLYVIDLKKEIDLLKQKQ